MEISIDLPIRYSYADYLSLADNKMRELIDGIIKLMSPAPSSIHQRICGNLFAKMHYFIKKNRGACEVFTAPFDVRLPKNGETDNKQIYNVVQPDICVVCDPSKIDKRGCLGAPDLIVEIQSKYTARYDLTEKYNLYETSGVKEYWVVFPYDGITVYLLQPDGKYDKGTNYDEGKIPVNVLNGCEIDLTDIF
jgi:Uma2 family endonuclease